MLAERDEASDPRRWRAVLALLVLGALVAVVAFLVSCSTGGEDEAAASDRHPPYEAGLACDSAGCHDDFTHVAPYTGPCDRCHSLNSWRIIAYTHENAVFNESFHGVIGCSYCHEEGEAPPAPACANCHLGRSPHEDGRRACERCHVATAWSIVTFPSDHISLEGGHEGLACASCHDPETFEIIDFPFGETSDDPNGCENCHGAKHGFTEGCADCHSPAREWNVGRGAFPHATFPLVGAHRGVSCEQCHGETLAFAGTSKRCASCHGPKHGGVANCEDCHSYVRGDWSVDRSKVDHGFFPLEGGHAGVACERCHGQSLTFAGTSSRCVGCHGAKHGGLTECELCHSPQAGWKVLHFGHTFYPLYGVHATNACSSCHPGLIFRGRDPACTICHGRPHGSCLTTCYKCHNTKSWKPADFDHSSVFPLTGAHSNLDCSKCHPNGIEFCQVPGRECRNCHGTRHGSCQPNCQNCHNTTAWKPPKPSFGHPSSFPLTGQHAQAACSACHPNEIFCNNPPTSCSSCHGRPHGACLPTCQNCHTPSGWCPADFNHSSVFPLTGQHATLPCSNCHGDPNDPYNVEFCRVPGDQCADCHGTPHGACLPTCQNCHTPAGFDPADFNHSSVFPLIGEHATLECSQCHGDPNEPDNIEFCIVPGRNCVDCHGPNHGGLTDCARCHTPVGWVPIRPDFGHPIPLGGFHGITPADPTCSVCHRNNNFVQAPRDCVICHLDTIPHGGPLDCVSCHWPTYWADLHFEHPALPPPHDPFLDECGRCHPGGDFTRLQCSPCHAGVPPL